MSALLANEDDLLEQFHLLEIEADRSLVRKLLAVDGTVAGAIDYYYGHPEQFEPANGSEDEPKHNISSPLIVPQNVEKEQFQSPKEPTIFDKNPPSLFTMLVEMGYAQSDAQKASKRCSSIEAAVNYLLGGNTTAEPEFDCPICMCEYPASEMITLACEPVAHRMCTDCFEQYCTSKIKEDQVDTDQLICPARLDNNKVCGTAITAFELKAHLPTEIFEKYERFITRSYCEHEKLSRCPKCNTWYVDLNGVPEDIWKDVKCLNCDHQFCGRCGEAPHKGQNEQNLTCEEFSKWKQENEKADESFEAYLKENKIFSCPSCKLPGVLDGNGCKFLYCRCKSKFCALCGVKLEESQHYTHFKNAPFGTDCLGPTDAAK